MDCQGEKGTLRGRHKSGLARVGSWFEMTVSYALQIQKEKTSFAGGKGSGEEEGISGCQIVARIKDNSPGNLNPN